MKKEVFLALLDSVLDEKVQALKGELEPIKGERGLRGRTGKPFQFEENKEEITNIIVEYVDTFKATLTETIQTQTNEELKDLWDTQEKFTSYIDESIDSAIGRLTFKLSDLTNEERDSLKGEKGPRGQRGKPGERGEVGPQGEAGIPGEVGALGEPGPQGEKGSRGQRGRKGDNGLQGDIGPQGEIGIPGEVGPQGEVGEKGPRGQRGRKGDTGLQGEVGPQGVQGLRGLPGVQGVQGFTGKSGLEGADGNDGQDAPKIIDIKLEKIEKDIYFVFYFDDGSKVRTDQVELPTQQTVYYSSMCSSGGSGGGGIVEGAAKLIVTKTTLSDTVAYKDMMYLTSSTEVDTTDHGSYEESLALGLALETRNAGEEVQVLTFGIADDVSFTFALHDKLFLGVDGAITNTPTTTVGEFVTPIGQSLGPGAIYIQISEPEEVL